MYKIIGADQKEYGPITAEQMQQWIAEGRVNAQTLVWSETSGNWKPLSSYPELAGSIPGYVPGAVPSPGFSTQSQFGSPKSNPMALWGMVAGIVALPMTCCCYGIPFNIVAIILSSIALRQIKNDPTQTGRGMALAGLILGIVSLIGGIAIGIAGVAFQDDLIKWSEKYK